MSRLMLLPALMIALWFAAPVGEGQDRPSSETSAVQARRHPPVHEEQIWFHGWVRAVSTDSITIQGLNLSYSGGKGFRREGNVTIQQGRDIVLYHRSDRGREALAAGVELRLARDGATVTRADGSVVMFRDADVLPMTFRANPHMARGEFAYYKEDNESYRLSDVEVGDFAQVLASRPYYVKEGPKGRETVYLGPWVCAGVGVLRRPGGRVPPSQTPYGATPWHERVNAIQDFEERGIPLPQRFWTSEQWDKVAPAPRTGFAKIPEAAP